MSNKFKDLWLALRKKRKPLYDALLKAVAQKKLAVEQAAKALKPASRPDLQWPKPEKIYYEPPEGVSPDGLRFPSRRPQQESYLGQSAAYQRLTGRVNGGLTGEFHLGGPGGYWR